MAGVTINRGVRTPRVSSAGPATGHHSTDRSDNLGPLEPIDKVAESDHSPFHKMWFLLIIAGVIAICMIILSRLFHVEPHSHPYILAGVCLAIGFGFALWQKSAIR